MMVGLGEYIKDGDSIAKIVARDAIITFIITLISVLIAYPPFGIPLIAWLENIYVPILTAILTAVVSYAHAVGAKTNRRKEA